MNTAEGNVLASTFHPDYVYVGAEERRPTLLREPIFDPVLPLIDDDILELSEADIIGNADDNAAFRARVDAHCPPIEFHFSTDVNMRYVEAYDLLEVVRSVVSVHGIRTWCNWYEDINSRMELPEAVLGLAQAREGRNHV